MPELLLALGLLGAVTVGNVATSWSLLPPGQPMLGKASSGAGWLKFPSTDIPDLQPSTCTAASSSF